MATEHTINSSLLFLTLILGELPTLSEIRQISPKNQGVSVVWNKSSGTNEPNLENYEWSSFILQFSKPFNINSLIKKYPSSVKRVKETAADMEAAQAEKDRLRMEAEAASAEQDRARSVSKVKSINSKNYNRNAPNGVNPSNIYSGIGPAKKNGDKWRVNFIDPGPPVNFKRAEANNADKAVMAAEKTINARRKKTIEEMDLL